MDIHPEPLLKRQSNLSRSSPNRENRLRHVEISAFSTLPSRSAESAPRLRGMPPNWPIIEQSRPARSARAQAADRSRFR